MEREKRHKAGQDASAGYTMFCIHYATINVSLHLSPPGQHEGGGGGGNGDLKSPILSQLANPHLDQAFNVQEFVGYLIRKKH